LAIRLSKLFYRYFRRYHCRAKMGHRPTTFWLWGRLLLSPHGVGPYAVRYTSTTYYMMIMIWWEFSQNIKNITRETAQNQLNYNCSVLQLHIIWWLN